MIIKVICFVVLGLYNIFSLPFIVFGIYLFLCKICIGYIIFTISLIFGELTAKLVISLVTTNLGFWSFCLIVTGLLIKFELELLGIKHFRVVSGKVNKV